MTQISPSLKSKSTYLGNALAERVAVSHPYNALKNVQAIGEELYAEARVELPIGLEKLPMSAAEIGRHGAITGLYGVAYKQKDDLRRYYLAQEAFYEGHGPKGGHGLISFQAEVVSLAKREAAAIVRASHEGAAIATLRVKYSLLQEKVFGRLFETTKKPSLKTSRYSAELSGKFEKQGSMNEFVVPSLPVEVCSGHFETHPALPVAAMMSRLSQQAGGELGRPYWVKQAAIKAERLCWAGEEVRFRTRHKGSEGPDHYYECEALGSGIVKGSMELTLTTLS